jgi:uncharacterized protein (DUF2384 family)
MSKVAPVTVEVLPASIQNQAESVSYLLRVLLFVAPRSSAFRLQLTTASTYTQRNTGVEQLSADGRATF